MPIDHGTVVVDDARGDWIAVFSMVKDLLTPEHINEDEFHSVMAELLSTVITLFFDYSLKPLSPLDYQLIVDRCNYIGFVRKKQGKLLEAWASHERALGIVHEHLPPTHPRLAMTYSYIRLLYSSMNNHLSALDCLEKALDIQEKALQPNHPHLAETHFNMSMVFKNLNKIDDAFRYAKKAIDIGNQSFLTSDDPQMKK